MAVMQNVLDIALQYPLPVKAVDASFYLDNTVTGADSIKGAVALQQQVQELFDCGGLTLHKWNSSNPAVLRHVPDELKNPQLGCTLPDTYEHTKMLDIEWNTALDH